MLTVLPRMVSHRSKAGRPSVLTATSAATISASGVLWDTHDCFLLTPFSGKKVFGPVIAMNTPVVDLEVSWHPAKSASAYRLIKFIRRVTDISDKRMVK